LNGEVELPALEAWIAPAASAAPTVVSTRMEGGEDLSAEGIERVTIPIGRVQVLPLRELSEAGDSTSPRPPADVLGRRWSVRFILAVALAVGAGLGGAAAVAARISEHRRAGQAAHSRHSARREALRELDRIRSLGWHREGKVVEFYAATTDVLRRFSEQREPDWGSALTSTELLAEIRTRWGPEPAEGIASAIPAAERAKFGRYRPGPDDADAHWAAVRAWIDKMPED
jgi:hypothetical protein